MYDSTQTQTYDAMRFWIDQIKDLVNTQYNLFIIAAKIDLSEKESVSIKEAAKYARECGAELF